MSLANKSLARIASLLSRLQNRLNTVGRETSQNNRCEAQQTLRDQNNVQSLVNLRDSTQKAFEQVKRDVETLMSQINTLKSRITDLENRPAAVIPAPSNPLPNEFNLDIETIRELKRQLASANVMPPKEGEKRFVGWVVDTDTGEYIPVNS